MAKNLDALVIDKALELIKEGWAKNVQARDVRSREVEPTDAGAVRFCATGAIARAEHDLGVPATCRGHTQRLLEAMLEDDDVEGYNDSSPNKRRVVALFEQARERVRA